MTVESDDIDTRINNGIGFITLNRPKAINSLTHAMVRTMSAILTRWANDDTIRAVILNGAGERGLCAGGDVVAIYHSARAGNTAAQEFWFDEYRLNAQIGSYPKPYIAVMDGIVMGGGIGVSAHASVRIVTDRSSIAMPEVGIGFIPDVGGTYLLSRCAGGLGLYTALTGAPCSGSDAIALGLADYYIPHDACEAFTATVVNDSIATAIHRYALEPPPSNLLRSRGWIDSCFDMTNPHQSVSDIVAALASHPDASAQEAAKLITTRSPIALAVTLASLRRASTMSTLKDILVQEYRVSCAALRSHDLIEGIRAQIVDKDRNPAWSPASPEEVTTSAIESYFTPAEPDLTF